MHVEFVVDDFVIVRRVVRQVPAVGEHAWVGKCRYRVTEVAWFLDDEEPEHVADIRLVEAGRPRHRVHGD